jgi:hypothetical protein
MAWLRILASATLAAVLGTASGAFALADPPPWAHGQGAPLADGFARSHAVVSGRVVGVDFATASILVETAHGRVPIAVTPSTNIFRGAEFASFAELGRGSRVDIDVSEIAGRLVAQIIRIR